MAIDADVLTIDADVQYNGRDDSIAEIRTRIYTPIIRAIVDSRELFQ